RVWQSVSSFHEPSTPAGTTSMSPDFCIRRICWPSQKQSALTGGPKWMPSPCISLAGKYDIPRGLWTSWALNPCQSLPALVRTTVGAVGGVPAAVLGPQAEPDITGILAAYSPEPTGGVPAGRRHRFQ